MANSKRSHYHPAIESSSLHVIEHFVDIFELHLVVMGVDLPLGGKLDCVREILTATNDRTADRDSVQNHVENRCLEFTWRQAHQGYRASAPNHMYRLAECRRRNGRN